MSQEAEALLAQLRGVQLDQDTWQSADVVWSQLSVCVHYCMACTANTCWSCLRRQLDDDY